MKQTYLFHIPVSISLRKLILILPLLILPVYGITQDENPELITDRPDQTESAAVVPKHLLQVETGTVRESDSDGLMEISVTTYNTTLLRFGLFDRLELRLGSGYLEESVEIQDPESQEVLRGFGPLYTGFKAAITEKDGWIPQVAIVGGLIFQQVAGKDFRQQSTSVDLRFAISHTLSDRFSLGYNLGFEYDGITAVPGFFYSVALGMGITERLGAFLESYGLVPGEGASEHLFDAGFTWLLKENIQLDISGGAGLNDHAMDRMISCGLSFRLPR